MSSIEIAPMEISESKTHFDDELDKSQIKTSNIMLHKLGLA